MGTEMKKTKFEKLEKLMIYFGKTLPNSVGLKKIYQLMK